MTLIARRIIACPVRSATEVWNIIIDLIAPQQDSPARAELLRVAGITSSLIADEVMTEPIIIYGAGPRVRIYCLYGEDAIIGELASETPLSFYPTDGDWNLSLPCSEDDLAWVQSSLGKYSNRISARDLTAGVDEEASAKTLSTGLPQVDREAFLRE